MLDVFHLHMITFLSGKLVEALPTQVVVDVNGVGYEVLIPLSSFDKIPAPGQPVKLLTQLVVREDAHILYGFATAAERDLFRLLINNVSGIGPKTALNILSGMNAVAFRGAVASSDVKSLSQISGVGKKTAERIVVELRDKIGAAGAWEAAARKMRFRPTTRKRTTPCSRSWRWVSNRLMLTTPFAPPRRCSAHRPPVEKKLGAGCVKSEKKKKKKKNTQ